jgi:hypothetical protein
LLQTTVIRVTTTDLLEEAVLEEVVLEEAEVNALLSPMIPPVEIVDGKATITGVNAGRRKIGWEGQVNSEIQASKLEHVVGHVIYAIMMEDLYVANRIP